ERAYYEIMKFPTSIDDFSDFTAQEPIYNNSMNIQLISLEKEEVINDGILPLEIENIINDEGGILGSNGKYQEYVLTPEVNP
ncbi:MAG: hypothetical protein ACP5RS_07425, partial [Thermoplasmata archaeon]